MVWAGGRQVIVRHERRLTEGSYLRATSMECFFAKKRASREGEPEGQERRVTTMEQVSRGTKGNGF